MSHNLPKSSNMPAPDIPRTRAVTILGIPAWLAYSLLTILLWGAWGATSKIASAGVDANTNQIFFAVGLLPLMLLVLRSPRIRSGRQRGSGIVWAFFTGILGGVGNIAFFHALSIGGKASVVVPATALFPVVTVILAVTVLRERISIRQWLGLALAFAAIYLLAM